MSDTVIENKKIIYKSEYKSQIHAAEYANYIIF